MATQLYDSINSAGRTALLDVVRKLTLATYSGVSSGVYGYSVQQSQSVDYQAYEADTTLRQLGWTEYMFPTDEAIYPNSSTLIIPDYIWLRYGAQDVATGLPAVPTLPTIPGDTSTGTTPPGDTGGGGTGITGGGLLVGGNSPSGSGLLVGGSSNNYSDSSSSTGSGLLSGGSSSSTDTSTSKIPPGATINSDGLVIDSSGNVLGKFDSNGNPILPPDSTGQIGGGSDTTPTQQIPGGIGEVANNTVWYRCAPMTRSELLSCAYRVVEMTEKTQMGGTQPGEHADTGSSPFNNPRSVDWAIWKLLMALVACGYSKAPLQ